MNLLLLHAWGTTDSLTWNGVSWAVSAEWFAYLLLVFPVSRLGKGLSITVLVIVTIGLWVLLFLYLLFVATSSLNITYDFGIFRIIPEYFAGYTLYRVYVAFPRKKCLGDMLTLVNCALVGLLAALGGPEILLLPCFCMLLYGLAQEGRWCTLVFGNRPVRYLGELSYAVYMVHPIILLFARIVIARTSVASTVTSGVVLLCALSVSILAFSVLLYRCVEIPSREWLKCLVSPSIKAIRNVDAR